MTKLVILRESSSIYDLLLTLGILGPITVRAKLLMQHYGEKDTLGMKCFNLAFRKYGLI